jgi:hypothetical protein
MFRKASYITMVASVILSWGLIINVAEKADKANGTEVALGPSAQSYLVKLTPSKTALEDTSREKLKKERPVDVSISAPKSVISRSALLKARAATAQ